MAWLPRMLAGPVLWGLLFSAIYALHGVGCALDWPTWQTPLGPLHPGAMILAWVAGLVLHGLLIVLNHPQGSLGQARLIRAGNWIGAVSSAVTLLPVIVASSCA